MTPSLLAYLLHFVGRFYDEALNLVTEFSVPVGTNIYLLGKPYSSTEVIDESVTLSFLDDFESRILLTYRRNIDGLYTLTSDAGWGCTIRSTQMLVAQSLSSLLLGSDWRISSREHMDIYKDILSNFLDIPSAALSIHKIVDFGQTNLGIIPGNWFGPDGAIVAVTRLWNSRHQPNHHIGAINFRNGEVSSSVIRNALSSHTGGLMILVSLVKGSGDMSPEHKDQVLVLFKNKYFQGMVGGDISRAFYIPAASVDYLYNLDPHIIQPALVNPNDNIDQPYP